MIPNVYEAWVESKNSLLKWNHFFYNPDRIKSALASDGQRARFLGTGRTGIAHWWHGQNGQLPIKEISGTGMPYQAMGI